MPLSYGRSRAPASVAAARTSAQPSSPNHRASVEVAPCLSDTATTAATTLRIALASRSSRRMVPIDCAGSWTSQKASSTSQWTAFVRSGHRGSRRGSAALRRAGPMRRGRRCVGRANPHPQRHRASIAQENERICRRPRRGEDLGLTVVGAPRRQWRPPIGGEPWYFLGSRVRSSVGYW
jgi:hypothetical protein